MTMNSTDALATLIASFDMESAVIDGSGNLAYEFLGDFEFAAIEVNNETVRLSAAFDDVNVDCSFALKRRLLEASIMGVETGFGCMAPDPMQSGKIALVDTIQLAELDEDDFKIRMVDFMLHVEYWRSEGMERAIETVEAQMSAPSGSDEHTMIRA